MVSDYKMDRREFGKKLIYGTLGIAFGGTASLLSPKKVYPDGITKDPELLKMFNQACEMIRKGRGKEFKYEIKEIDLDDDGRNNDSLVAEFVNLGTMRNEKDVFDDGPKLTLKFNVSGTKSRLWGLFKGGKCKYANIYWGDSNKMKKYLGNVLDNLEKKD